VLRDGNARGFGDPGPTRRAGISVQQSAPA